MSSGHYIHLFDWKKAATARIKLGDNIFDPFVEINPVMEEEKYGGSLFLSGIEIPLDRVVNNTLGDYDFQGAPRWFDLITQELSNTRNMGCLAEARTQLMPFLSPKYRACDLQPLPVCSFVPTIVSPIHAETILGSLRNVDLTNISTDELHRVTRRINPDQAPNDNPYFPMVGDLSRYIGMFMGLFQQSVRDHAGVVSYFD